MDGRGSSAATRTDGRMIEAPTRPGTADRTASAQRGLITYLVVVMVLSAVLEGVMIASRLDVLVIVLMGIPGLPRVKRSAGAATCCPACSRRVSRTRSC